MRYADFARQLLETAAEQKTREGRQRPSAILLAMPARNRRLPRHRAWPLTTTDINECLGPLMTRNVASVV
ncbi:hypothetical protein ACWD5Q_11045 [Streptomyces sp. NPDC002513]